MLGLCDGFPLPSIDRSYAAQQIPTTLMPKHRLSRLDDAGLRWPSRIERRRRARFLPQVRVGDLTQDFAGPEAC